MHIIHFLDIWSIAHSENANSLLKGEVYTDDVIHFSISRVVASYIQELLRTYFS